MILEVWDVPTKKIRGTLDCRSGTPEGSERWLLTVRRDGVSWEDWDNFTQLINGWSNGYVAVYAVESS